MSGSMVQDQTTPRQATREEREAALTEARIETVLARYDGKRPARIEHYLRLGEAYRQWLRRNGIGRTE